jgi:hypothetical protein
LLFEQKAFNIGDKMRKKIILLVAALLWSGPAAAGLKEAIDLMLKDQFELAEKELAPLARRGDVNAKYYLAMIKGELDYAYKERTGVSREAVRQAKQGKHGALDMLGMVYAIKPASQFGNILQAGMAQQNLRAAAESGEAEAAYRIALMEASEKNYRSATNWLARACVGGKGPACNNLGVFTRFGFGRTEPDPVEAVNWLSEGAKLKDPYAHYNLALMYSQGHGTARNYLLAWIQARAAEKRLKNKQKKLQAAALADTVKKKFSPLQRDYANMYGEALRDNIPMPPATGYPLAKTDNILPLSMAKPKNPAEQPVAGALRFAPLDEQGPVLDLDNPARKIPPIPYVDSPAVIADMIYRLKVPSLIRAPLRHRNTVVTGLPGDKLLLLIPTEIQPYHSSANRNHVPWRLSVPGGSMVVNDRNEMTIVPLPGNERFGWVGWQLSLAKPGRVTVEILKPQAALEERKAAAYNIMIHVQ